MSTKIELVPGVKVELRTGHVKAAALFRAAYEMQQALKAIKSGGNKLYTRDWNMMITALALSENTESTAL